MVTLPLIALAIPSVCIGWMTIEPTLIGDYFGNSIVVAPAHHGLAEFLEEWHGVGGFMLHGVTTLPFLARHGRHRRGVVSVPRPAAPASAHCRYLRPLYTLLENKYYFDRFNDWFFAGGAPVGSFLERR